MLTEFYFVCATCNVGPEAHTESASELLKSTFEVEVCLLFSCSIAATPVGEGIWN